MEAKPTTDYPNGVNLDNIQALLDAIDQTPEAANVQFRATSKWLGGTQTEVHVSQLMSGGTDIARAGRSFTLRVDEPRELGGADAYPNPVEHLAAALCGCLTAGIATNAALFGTELDAIEVEVEVNFDLHGVLGLDADVPSGPLDLNYNVRLSGPGAEEAMRRSKETIDRKSPVANALSLPLQTNTTSEIG